MIAIMLSPFFIALQNFADAKERKLAEGQVLFQQGDKVDALFLVVSGEIRLIRYQADGSSITLQRTQAGSVLAEASLYSYHYHCHALAQRATCVSALPKETVIKYLQTDPKFAFNWSGYLAREVQQARFRSELLSLKTVAARLDAWLNWQGQALPAKGEWKVLAEQLGVSAEALYREIARRS
ncbi:cAMP-binding domain of CRP or a regulatory subunit of cAMP-dependent protein kinases [Thiothrix eikelboomii]|uniref:cAMP-binding domain of CRP or a regulatory subunit of cAMP-dependent protein kinases n=2 Tax=Thiothrix eikelboomii TaxID=92487 RepID=A0A1T4XP66_9GAMM|nr:cAMP-binding domain of CRP or a regulatory subunit of cAMP-dependent protein kinases [Thiothrix eikelboomii]